MAIKVPPGQYPPFEVVDDQHHAGIIIIVAAIILVISLVCLLIRVYVRVLLSSSFGYDDFILLAATICAIVESIIVFYAASIGFGTTIKLLNSKEIHDIQKLLVASDIFYLLTLYLSKCCVVAIYQRLTPRELHKNTLWAVFAFSTAVIIVSILIITIDCSLNVPWVIPGQSCTNLFARWQFITAIDIVIEVSLFAFAFALVYNLQMPRKHKFVILLSFASRLPLIIFEALRLSRFHNYANSKDPTFVAVDHYVWTQVGLNYSLIACTVFCLRPFINAFTTFLGTAGDSNLGSSGRAYHDGSNLQASNRSQESYALNTLYNDQSGGNGSKVQARTTGAGTGEASLAPSRSASARRGADSDYEEEGAWSTKSTRMLIRKDVEYSVSHMPRGEGE